MNERQVFKVVFPGFDETSGRLPPAPMSCLGTSLLDQAVFAGGSFVRNPRGPFEAQEGDVTFGSGGDGLKIVWLRTHTFSDRSAAGPLGVVRATERFAELFALGTFRALPEQVSFTTVRVGGSYLVSAVDDGCGVRKPRAACETKMHVFRPHLGRLDPLAQIVIERVAPVGRAERGSVASQEYHMTSVPEFNERRIKIVEQVRVSDDGGHDLRKAERERDIPLDGSATAVTASLWDEMVGPQPSAASAKP